MTSLREPVLGLALVVLAFLGGAGAAAVLATPSSPFEAPPRAEPRQPRATRPGLSRA